MSKMIRVESCDNCPIRTSGIYKDSFKLCKDLMDIHAKDLPTNSGIFTIKDLSKILPNCPLEDYPDSDKLDKIKSWCEAYPVKIFPEPDFEKMAKVLKDNGMTIDSIGASSMRHVLEGIKKIIEGDG